jgi:hypothetical protein
MNKPGEHMVSRNSKHIYSKFCLFVQDDGISGNKPIGCSNDPNFLGMGS